MTISAVEYSPHGEINYLQSLWIHATCFYAINRECTCTHDDELDANDIEVSRESSFRLRNISQTLPQNVTHVPIWRRQLIGINSLFLFLLFTFPHAFVATGRARRMEGEIPSTTGVDRGSIYAAVPPTRAKSIVFTRRQTDRFVVRARAPAARWCYPGVYDKLSIALDTIPTYKACTIALAATTPTRR